MMISSLRAMRLLKGLRIYEVSALTGINQATLSFAERGLTKLSSAQIERLAKVLGVTPEEIWDGIR